MNIRVAVQIASAGHKPERRTACDRLVEALLTDPPRKLDYSIGVEQRPGRPHEWSERQWRTAHAVSEATHCLFLNDDMVPARPAFWRTLWRVIRARPTDILSLYASPPVAQQALRDGASWVTTPDGLIGNAYVIPRGLLGQFLEWRAEDLVPGAVERLSEDQLVNLFAMSTGRLIWHTVPSLFTHDTSLASCYGNEPVPAIPPEGRMWKRDWTRIGPAGPRYFRGNHGHLLTAIKPAHWPVYDCVRRYYALARNEPLPP